VGKHNSPTPPPRPSTIPPPLPEDTSQDTLVRIAYLPDPVKIKTAPPKPGVRQRIQKESCMHFVEVTVQDICDGVLEKQNFNVLCIPGGFAPNYLNCLGNQGKAIIQSFIEKGGGYVGICAGAYLAIWYSLLRCRVKSVPWARGRTDKCVLEVHPGGEAVLGPEAEIGGQCVVRYCNGPLLEVTEEGTGIQGGTRSLATFVTELRGAKNTYPPAMAGSSAIAAGAYGRGRVVIISPHVEDGELPHAPRKHAHKFRCMYRWASGLVKDPAAVASTPYPNTTVTTTVTLPEMLRQDSYDEEHDDDDGVDDEP